MTADDSLTDVYLVVTELPEPLLTREFYSEWMRAAG